MVAETSIATGSPLPFGTSGLPICFCITLKFVLGEKYHDLSAERIVLPWGGLPTEGSLPSED